MGEYLHEIYEMENGTNILIFKEVNGSHIFDRKVFVPVSEYWLGDFACAVDEKFKTLYASSHKFVVGWLKENPGRAKMVCVGRDFQILSVDEYLSIFA